MIGQQLQQYSGHLSVCPPKTAGSQRAVALDRTTVTGLRRHRAAQESERTALGDAHHDSGYLFTGVNGDPMAPTGCPGTSGSCPPRPACLPSGSTTCGNGAASLALAAAAELKTIQDQLGHSSIVLTADTYISVLPRNRRPGSRGHRHARYQGGLSRARHQAPTTPLNPVLAPALSRRDHQRKPASPTPPARSGIPPAPLNPAAGRPVTPGPAA